MAGPSAQTNDVIQNKNTPQMARLIKNSSQGSNLEQLKTGASDRQDKQLAQRRLTSAQVRVFSQVASN